MFLYRADENGIIFHTASTKDVYAQIKRNPKAEMCFFGNGIDHLLQIFRMKNCEAVTWTMETNFSEKKPILLCKGK